MRAQRGDSARVGEDLGGAERVPRVDDQAVRRRALGDRAQRLGPAERAVVGRHDDDVGVEHRLVEAGVGVATSGSCTATSASSRSSSRISLCDSESRSSSVSRLNASPSTATLRSRSEPPSRRLTPSTRNSGTLSLHARDGQQHARGVRALLGEREVLAQARPGREPGLRDPAARVVAVDQVDDLEDVRAVALAVHHQQVRERERRVAQDVGPDLRQLGLDRRRSARSARRATSNSARGALARALADAADDARQRPDLLQEAVGGDPLGHVGDEHVLADAEAAVLLQVAGHELGRAGGDRRAQDQQVALRAGRQQVVEHRADVAHVDLDVRERSACRA